MKYSSDVKMLGAVEFPAFIGQRVYMREFRKETGLPADLANWQPTVDAMLQDVDTDGLIYLMIDQSVVQAGVSQRRPGVHIDGYWHAGSGWKVGGHVRNSARRHAPQPPGHCSSATSIGWGDSDFAVPEDIILASDVTASRVFLGEWSGSPGEGGDCSHIDTSGLIAMPLQAGIAYAGNVTMLHESTPVAVTCQRTLVRLNVQGWGHA